MTGKIAAGLFVAFVAGAVGVNLGIPVALVVPVAIAIGVWLLFRAVFGGRTR